MWSIQSITVDGDPNAQVYVSDGEPITARRGPEGMSYRIGIVGHGFIDVTDTGHLSGGPHYWQLVFDSQIYWYDGEGAPVIVVTAGSFVVTGDGNRIGGPLQKFATVDNADIAVIEGMETAKLIPYPDVPEQGRPFSAVEYLAKQYFGFTAWARVLALSVYDWTTADFFRFDLFNLYRYSALKGQPLDDADIVHGIATADWPPYEPSDASFMASMMMTPCTTEQQVAAQYAKVHEPLRKDIDALTRVTAAAIESLPRTSVIAKPNLYSGQVAISNLGEQAMAVYFREYPGNAGPVGQPMGMPLADALAGFMKPGNTVHLKTIMSFTDSLEDAAHYSNGIVIQMSPVPRSVVWVQGTHTTSLSDEANKVEYTFPLGSGFRVDGYQTKVISEKTVTLISMTEMP